MTGEILVEAKNLSRHFTLPGGKVLKAVDDVSFIVRRGQTCCIVGESGSGKTTTVNMVLGLDRPTGGRILWEGEDLARLDRLARRRYRRCTSAVLQNPNASLDPRIRIAKSVAEPLEMAGGMTKAQIDERILDCLRAVGISAAQAMRFPHEFSGGQRQRIAIARAIASKPDLIVLDEPVASLDVSIQAQVMNLLKRLQLEQGIAYLMISHNLATVRFLAHEISVMYLGRFVEAGPSREVLGNANHDYTRRLIEAARLTEGGMAAAARLPS